MHRWIAAVLLACSAGVAQASGHDWELQLPGVSHHFEKPRKRGAQWNEWHDGVGLQRTIDRGDRLHDGWIKRYSAGFMLDSHGNESAYLGAGLAWRHRGARFDVDAGAAPMLLYRTTRFDDHRGEAPLKLIPAILPTLSVQHRRSGTGANIVVVPAMHLRDFRMPGLVFVQFTRQLE